MAEPLRSNEHPEIEPDIRPDLHVLEGGGESTPERASLRSASPAKDLRDQERAAGNSEGNATSPQEQANINDVREREQAGGGWQNNYTGNNKATAKKGGTLKALAQRKGPLGLLISILLVGGFSITAIPSFLPMWLRSTAENFYGNASRTTQYHYRSTLRYRIGNTAACSNPASIRCKLASVNDKTLKKYTDQGFKVESEKVGDRHVIKAVTFPDGTRVTDGDAFVNHMDSSVSAKSRVFAIFNPRSGPYIGQQFTKLLQKFGLFKDKVVISGKDRDAIAKSFDREVGATDENEDEATRRQRAEGEASTISDEVDAKGSPKLKAAGKITNVAGLACATYDYTRLALGLVKAKQAAKYVAYAWLFLKLADQIRAGDADSTTIAAAAGVLTATAASGDFKGKTALDSPGVRAMAYGDRTGLKDNLQKILLGGNTALVKLDNTLIKVKETLGGSNMRSVCKTSNNPLLGFGMSVLACGGGGGAAGTIVPGVGNAVGGIAGVLGCSVANFAIAIAGSAIFGYILKEITPILVDYLAGKPLAFNLAPEDAGNAITVGAGLLFAGVGQQSGLKLATKDEAQGFSKVAFEADRDYAEVARYDAQKTPFDMTNEYSFMGQFTRQLGMYNSGGNLVSSTLGTITSSIVGARTSLITSAAYAADMPSALNSQTLGTCPDPELAEKNLGCDSVGNPQTVQSKEEMTRSMQSNLDYMIGHNYVDEDGNIPEGSDYKKFVTYCTGESAGVPGTSTLSIEDDDADWPDARCQSDEEEVSQFRTYTSRVGINSDEDTQYEDGNTGTSPSSTSSQGSDVAGDDYSSEVNKVLGRAGTGQCVDFVLFRLVKHKVLSGPIALGNGKDVVGTLGKMGYKVDTTPAVHSVMSTPVTSQPQYGHTAMVSQVNADGSFVVEEYNYANALHYSTRTIPASDIAAKKMTFAHTEVDYK